MAMTFTCERRRMDEISVFSSCNMNNRHWILGVSTVSGCGQAQPHEMAAESWTLVSTNKFKWQAKAHDLVEGLVRRALLPKIPDSPTASP